MGPPTADASALEPCSVRRDATTGEACAHDQRRAPTRCSKRKALTRPRRSRAATDKWVWQKERAFYVWVYGRDRTKLAKDRKCFSVLLLPKSLVEKHWQTQTMCYQTCTCKLTGKSQTQCRAEWSEPPDQWSRQRDTVKVKNAFISQEWCLASHKPFFQTWPKPRRDTSKNSSMFLKTSITVIGLPRWLSGREPTCSAGDRDLGLIPGSGRPPGGGHGNPCQGSCLENPMGRGPWWATVHRVEESQTWLNQLSRVHYSNNHNTTFNVGETLSNFQ